MENRCTWLKNEGIEKWQPIPGITEYCSWSFLVPDKANQEKHLRFNPIQIAEWLDDLSSRAKFSTAGTLAKAFGLSQTRVTQYRNLLRFPEKYRLRLKAVDT